MKKSLYFSLLLVSGLALAGCAGPQINATQAKQCMANIEEHEIDTTKVEDLSLDVTTYAKLNVNGEETVEEAKISTVLDKENHYVGFKVTSGKEVLADLITYTTISEDKTSASKYVVDMLDKSYMVATITVDQATASYVETLVNSAKEFVAQAKEELIAYADENKAAIKNEIESNIQIEQLEALKLFLKDIGVTFHSKREGNLSMYANAGLDIDVSVNKAGLKAGVKFDAGFEIDNYLPSRLWANTTQNYEMTAGKEAIAISAIYNSEAVYDWSDVKTTLPDISSFAQGE